MPRKQRQPRGVKVQHCGPEDFDTAAYTIGKLKATNVPPAVGDHLREFLSNSRNILITATRERVPVGYLVAYLLERVDRGQSMACLYEVAVSETYRRRGVGRAMIETLKAICKKENVMKTWVIANRSNVAASRFYESTGAVADADGDNTVFVYLPPED